MLAGRLCLLLVGCVLFVLVGSKGRTTAASFKDGDVYSIGAGIADVTGPAAEINMMGYASLTQNAKGIHLRQFARAFVIDDGTTRVAVVSVDAGMISQIVKMEVVRKLGELYNGTYTNQNVLVSGTHTHSTPGGFFQYMTFTITSKGFINQTFNALVDGIVQSIVRADANVRPGRMYYNEGELVDASINRSPASYLQNPEEEREKYNYDTDKTMHLLKFVDLQGNPIGSINWFAVHCTSMNNTNVLISSDNKGYAAVLLEQAINPAGSPIGKGPFVAAFPNANEGDSSPNTAGAKCIDTGLPCDFDTSTCNGKNEMCIAFGPGKDMVESTKIIATKQFNKAQELFQGATEPVHGAVQFISQNIDMTKYPVQLGDGTTVTTCKPGLGFAFAAGTTDGPGMFDFHQATRDGTENLLWHFVRDILQPPSKELLDCHKPKPVLLPTGEINNPFPWHMTVVQTQIIRLGNIVILGLPGEFTTMSGRRMRDAVQQTLTANAPWVSDDLHVVVQGLSNLYTHYVATYEEYQLQRYEGASTLFGPHTQLAYAQQYQKLAYSMAKGEVLPDDLQPPNYMDRQFSLQMDVLMDSSPFGVKMGAPITDAKDSYVQGETVSVQFSCGNPRNNLMTESTFLTVEIFNTATNNFEIIATDASWDTRLKWDQVSLLLMQSMCTIEWDIPENTAPGQYRIQNYGYSKSFGGNTSPYVGTSRTFSVTAKNRFQG